MKYLISSSVNTSIWPQRYFLKLTTYFFHVPKRATERNIEIIGEAVNRILAAEGSLSISGARRIVDTRNFIIHEYEKVSDEILWAILIKHIPVLKLEVEQLIEQRS